MTNPHSQTDDRLTSNPAHDANVSGRELQTQKSNWGWRKTFDLLSALGTIVTILGAVWFISSSLTSVQEQISHTNEIIERNETTSKEQNENLQRSIEKIDERLDGLDRRLSKIEGKISNLSKDEKQSDKVSYPVNPRPFTLPH